MKWPIDTCENCSCAFAIRGEYDKRVYAKNLGLGGGGSARSVDEGTSSSVYTAGMEVWYV